MEENLTAACENEVNVSTDRKHVNAINVGQIREVLFAGKLIKTGFFKEPTAGSVFAGKLGLEGDLQADHSVHGGIDKAVYVYPREHYAIWEDVLGTGILPPGSFGENITTEGLLENQLCIGDVLRIGDATIQVRQPRSPCFKLQMRFERPDMVSQFVQQNRPGWYGAVLVEGSLKAGDKIEILSQSSQRISIADVWKFAFHQAPDSEQQKLLLGSELLPEFWKERFSRF